MLIEIKVMLTFADSVLTDYQKPNTNIKEVHELIDAL